ncbi:MAG: NAD-dependent DNA ligase LigA [Lachnospiraceae bacterium]|jgi:DNA ligase (NAD+)|nr:NAD-dependent DNA ligase LigA [Lachnospiraceae bacterium]
MTTEEYLHLKKTIDYHMDRYYNQDSPEISDYEYDRLMTQLKEAEQEHPEWVTPDSPTQKIGGSVKREAGVKVTHDVPMLSIEDVFSREEVTGWIEKVHRMHPGCAFSVETKIDGLSMSLRYAHSDTDGKLHLALAETRGDGLIGEDVTANALVIPDVKKIIDLPYDSLELRGEVYMSHADFERFNEIQEEQQKKPAANPRNLAAGTLRQLDTGITKERGLRMFVFNVQKGPLELTESHAKGLDILQAKEVPVVYHEVCTAPEEVLAAIEKIGAMREDLAFDIDGAVIKIDHTAYRNDFPAGSKYSSGHIAYKYPPEERIVVMDEIAVDVGRTGKLTFTGIFHDRETGKPARLCGTGVSKATLHNQDYIKEMFIGIGGEYKLFKSGEIIPKLNGCVKKPDEVFTAPEKCPVCGEPLIREEDTADIRCVNPLCPAQLTRTIAYFASLDCMNIMGLGDTLVDALVKQGYLKNYADIYKLKSHRDELVEKGIIGKEKNTDKVLSAIESSKNNDPVRLLTALGIRNVGKSTAREIMKHYSDIRELENVTVEELTAIPDIGETTAECIRSFFENEAGKAAIRELEECGVNMRMPENAVSGNKLTGLTFVVTGTLPTLGRKEIEELIVSNGGKCSGSVSKKTSYLIAGEAAGSKLAAAQKLGISIISEAEFLKMM